MTKRNAVVACLTVCLLILAAGCGMESKAKLEKAETELRDTRAELADATKEHKATVDELEAQLATASAARTEAAKLLATLKTQLADARSQVDTATAAAERAGQDLATSTKKTDATIATLTQERDEALTRAKTAESRAQGAEVRALIAEKDVKAATTALAAALVAADKAAAALAAANAATPMTATTPKKTNYPVVIIETSEGTIKAELWTDKAPITTKNFLSYVADKHYDNLIFHRVIKGFMIQGGGFDAAMKQRAVKAPIKNEASADKKNLYGTLAMARTNIVDSATSQFFINLKDNAFLDHTSATQQGFGYCAFGKVIEGLDIVDKIGAVATGRSGRYSDVPLETVLIKSIRMAK